LISKPVTPTSSKCAVEILIGTLRYGGGRGMLMLEKARSGGR
jgi:hypothetical protein